MPHVIRERIAVLEGPGATPRCYRCRATAPAFAYLIHHGIDQRLCKACAVRAISEDGAITSSAELRLRASRDTPTTTMTTTAAAASSASTTIRAPSPPLPEDAIVDEAAPADEDDLTERTSQVRVAQCATCRCPIPTTTTVAGSPVECTTCHRYRCANDGRPRPAPAITRDWIRKTAKEANPDRYARCQRCGTTHSVGWSYVLDEQQQHGIRVCRGCGGRKEYGRPSQIHLLSCVTCTQLFSTLVDNDRECATCSNYRRRVGRKRPTRLIGQHRDVNAIKSRNPDNRPCCGVCGSFFAGLRAHSAKQWVFRDGLRLCGRCAKLRTTRPNAMA